MYRRETLPHLFDQKRKVLPWSTDDGKIVDTLKTLWKTRSDKKLHLIWNESQIRWSSNS